jgi:hypothetical protein
MIYDGTGRSDILTYTATSGITKSNSYNFMVVAINAVGISALSPALTVLAAVIPASP